MLTPDQFRARSVDYLYGMLDGDALREFEESLQASADFRAELSALEQTLTSARAALRGPLDASPPAHVRAAILAAAKSASARSAEKPVREGDGFWAFLRRPWLIPACGVAAACALALVMVRRVERGEEMSAPPPPPMLPLSPEARAPAENGAPFPALGKGEATGSSGREEGRGGLGSAAPRGAPLSTPQKPAVSDRAQPKRSAASVDEAKTRRRAPSGASFEGAPPAVARAPAPAAEPERAREEAADVAAKAAVSSAKVAESSANAAPFASTKELDVASREVLLNKARAAHAAGRSGEEARIYRALLRRFPSDPAIDAWRRALSEAERRATEQF